MSDRGDGRLPLIEPEPRIHYVDGEPVLRGSDPGRSAA
jgi:hypothetical protein